MSVNISSISSSSSDESDNEKQQRSTPSKFSEYPPKKKMSSNGLNHKTYSSDSGDVINICSESGSEKESGASRDSDSSASVGCFPLSSRKRKTPEKTGSRASDNESASKIPHRDSSDSFLQKDSCSKLSKFGKIYKCRECFKSSDTNRYSCRFYSFRKTRWSKGNMLYDGGFASPNDATEEEKSLWLPDTVSSGQQDSLDFHVARFILSQVGDQFCSLMRQEEEAIQLHMREEEEDEEFIAWKKPMRGVREMCDVCKTTLFNFHWACGRCGFVVCIDCYKVRKNGLKKAWMVGSRDHDEWKWIFCTSRLPHEQDSLILCQTIAADCRQKLAQEVHNLREIFGIPQNCECEITPNSCPGLNVERLKELTKSDPLNAIISYLECQPRVVNNSVEHETRVVQEASKQKLPDDLSLAISTKNEDSDSDSDEDDNAGQSGLRALLVPSNPAANGNGSSLTRFNYPPKRQSEMRFNDQAARFPDDGELKLQSSLKPSFKTPSSKQTKISTKSIMADCFLSLDGESTRTLDVDKMQHFVRRNKGLVFKGQNQLPPRMMTNAQSQELYPGVPHSWLCDGWLLRLWDPSHNGNYKLFQDQWRRGQPVIVGNMNSLLNMDMWHPNSFCRDFGEAKNDLINCITGNLVPNRPMKEFWEGFENFSKRLKDEHGNPMLLKLKDWPPGEDFAQLLPERFKDLMQALPLAEYTRRLGRLNLASCLPDFFVRPDLGPKMYNAYGSACIPSKGTTNLHLDISDAVNFMVYVGIPTDADYEQHIQEAFNAIDEAGCDDMTRRRVRTEKAIPGALWHIYHACDSDKIRDLLNKVAIERGTRLEPHHDPIHDQSWYLDAELRKRLYKEYNVSGYAIVQCLGDAVFIPAGAPHQVRNLHNCVKVAEDFVSPENVSHCFYLTQEFRDLSDTHTNHEDKLQIKNIIYHTVKKAVSSLLREVTTPVKSKTE